jgi:hypothetical protein
VILWPLLARFLLLKTEGGSDDDDDAGDGGEPDGGSPTGDGDSDDHEKEGTPPDDAEATKNPKARIKSLLEANARLVRKLKARDKRIQELEADGDGDGDQLRTARLEVAFLCTVMNSEDRIDDVETAWTLGTARGYFDPVKISDDGEVEGMDEALGRLLERYPYLVGEDADDEEPPKTSGPSGWQPLKNREAAQASSEASMRQRFPALRRRRR